MSRLLACVTLAGSLLAAPALAATQVTPAPQAAQPALPPAPALSLEDKAGCGLLLTAVIETVQTLPAAAASLDKEGRGTKAVMMILGASGRTMLEEAFAEGAAAGRSATDVYRMGVVNIVTPFKDIKSMRDTKSDKLINDMLTRCAEIASKAQ